MNSPVTANYTLAWTKSDEYWVKGSVSSGEGAKVEFIANIQPNCAPSMRTISPEKPQKFFHERFSKCKEMEAPREIKLTAELGKAVLLAHMPTQEVIALAQSSLQCGLEAEKRQLEGVREPKDESDQVYLRRWALLTVLTQDATLGPILTATSFEKRN